MMDQKEILNRQDQLVHSRTEALNRQSAPIRPLGKLWGMDVFTWINPEPGALINTVGSFPFKVTWLGGVQEVSEVLSADDTLLGTVETVITYDSNVFGLKEDWLSSIVNGAGTSTLVDSLYFVDHFKAPKKMVLFTASGEKAIELLREFEDYVELMRSE